MDVEIREVEGGTEIVVKTEKRIAVVVEDEGGERIYLPESSGSDDTYYSENVESLRKTPEGYSVIHPGKVEDYEILK